MNSVKLEKIGQDLGIKIPGNVLEQAGFSKTDEYEFITSDDSITIVKKSARSDHQQMWDAMGLQEAQ